MGIRDPSGDLVSGCDDHGISVRCKLQDPDQLEVFYQEFFRKIADCRIKENPVHEKNADYVLLYYSAKIADIIFDNEKLDEEKKCRYEEGIESFLKQMEFPEIVMSNQHISRANKVYLLRKYYPDICKKFPDQADTILNPIYDNLRVKIFQPEKDQMHCEFSIVEQDKPCIYDDWWQHL